MVIADHVLKNQPVGSISWKWIEDSVKNGILADVEEHRAGPTEQVTRPVGSSQPARKGRTPFTTEDDRVLMKWCAKAERDGLSLKGNEIYQQLEKIVSSRTIKSKYRAHFPNRIIDIPINHGETAGLNSCRVSPGPRNLKKNMTIMMRKQA